MKNKKFEYRTYDIIKIQKIHANRVFEEIKIGNMNINFSDEDFMKERPAIIIKKINNIFLVIPLTTKPINNNSKSYAHNVLREEFKIKDFKSGRKSYLMYDSILRIDENQIIGLHKNGGNTIRLTKTNKKWLKSTSINKIQNIFI